MAKFFTRFSPPPSPSIDFPSDRESSQSKTHQEFGLECDINEIVRRYKVTGFLTDPSKPRTRKPMFGDFSEIPQPDEFARIIIQAENAWQAIPESERAKWPGGPGEILDALRFGKREDDLRAIGILPSLIEKAAVAATPEPGEAGKGEAQRAVEPPAQPPAQPPA